MEQGYSVFLVVLPFVLGGCFYVLYALRINFLLLRWNENENLRDSWYLMSNKNVQFGRFVWISWIFNGFLIVDRFMYFGDGWMEYFRNEVSISSRIFVYFFTSNRRRGLTVWEKAEKVYVIKMRGFAGVCSVIRRIS